MAVHVWRVYKTFSGAHKHEWVQKIDGTIQTSLFMDKQNFGIELRHLALYHESRNYGQDILVSIHTALSKLCNYGQHVWRILYHIKNLCL